MTKARLAAALFVGVLSTACGGISTPSSNTSTPFSGAVQPASIGPVHTFSVQNAGSREIDVMLTSLTPGNAALGILYGQSTGNACAQIQTSYFNNANVGKTILTTLVNVTGQYCVQLFDPAITLGGAPLPLPQNYTIQVSHP
jgi:hypothetical protein